MATFPELDLVFDHGVGELVHAYFVGISSLWLWVEGLAEDVVNKGSFARTGGTNYCNFELNLFLHKYYDSPKDSVSENKLPSRAPRQPCRKGKVPHQTRPLERSSLENSQEKMHRSPE